MELNISLIRHAVLEDYALPWGAYLGVAHWARALENGLRLAGETRANVEVVTLFALLHDSNRRNEGFDPDHGPGAARFALSIQGCPFDLPDPEFGLLHRACARHTHERTHPDVTVRTCWNADRLDLGRVGGNARPGLPLYRGGEVAGHPGPGRPQGNLPFRAEVRLGGVGQRPGWRPGRMLRPSPSRTRGY
jgi:uncharacterized protein